MEREGVIFFTATNPQVRFLFGCVVGPPRSLSRCPVCLVWRLFVTGNGAKWSCVSEVSQSRGAAPRCVPRLPLRHGNLKLLSNLMSSSASEKKRSSVFFIISALPSVSPEGPGYCVEWGAGAPLCPSCCLSSPPPAGEECRPAVCGNSRAVIIPTLAASLPQSSL